MKLNDYLSLKVLKMGKTHNTKAIFTLLSNGASGTEQYSAIACLADSIPNAREITIILIRLDTLH